MLLEQSENLPMADNEHARNPVWFTVAAFVVFVPFLLLGYAIFIMLWIGIGLPIGNSGSTSYIATRVLGISLGFVLFYFFFRLTRGWLKEKHRLGTSKR
jgi:hypothetical protein